VRLEHTLVVARPPEEVFAFLADPDNLPRWQTGVVEVRREGDRRHVDLAVVEGPLPLRISHTLEAEDGGTRILFVGEGEPRGLPRLLAGVAAKAVELQSQHDFAKLKRILEGGEE
jgi:carbon monoxide dehydrogenase subunit G